MNHPAQTTAVQRFANHEYSYDSHLSLYCIDLLNHLYLQGDKSHQIQNELHQIYGMFVNIDLHRTNRVIIAHGLDALVPFLDTEFTRLVMLVDPLRKKVDANAMR